ncbi:MAG: hypothetical protein RLZZ524_685 [Pseudomonadota bacterium]|jgi:cell wall-associated NlpC family hydrolase
MMEATETLTRHPFWPEALAAEIAAANKAPYVLGQHDCLRFTCRCIEVMTGVDFWPRFEGYKTRRQAYITIKAIAPTLGEAVSIVLGSAPIRVPQAQRGDVLLFADAAGEHLGICTGSHGAVLGEAGLVFVRLDDAGLQQAWRIG